MKTTNLFILICQFLFVYNIQGQNYSTYVKQGITEYNVLNFQSAINNFKAAKISASNKTEIKEAESWIEKANQGFIAFMKAATDKETKAKEEALLAQKEAERQAAISEASRLASLSGIAIEKNEAKDALLLTNLAINALEKAKAIASTRPIDKSINNTIKKAFARAVDKNYSKIIPAHTAPITQMKLAPLKNIILTAARDHKIKLWSLDGAKIAEIDFKELALSLIFSPIDKVFLCGGLSGNVHLYNYEGKLLKTFEGHTEDIMGATFTKDGKKILTWSRDNTAKLWSYDGKMLSSFQHQGNIYQAQFSFDEQLILTRSSDNTVKIWDIKGEAITTINNLESYIYQADFLPDSKSFLIVSAEKLANIYDLQGNLKTTFQHSSNLLDVNFTKQGNLFASIGQKSPTIRIWNRTGTLINQLKDKQEVKKGTFSANGQSFLSWGNNYTPKIWDVSSGVATTLDQHTKPIINANFSSNENFILTHALDNTFKLWDLNGNFLYASEHESVIPPLITRDNNWLITLRAHQQLIITPHPDIIRKELLTANKEFSTKKAEQYNLLNYE